MTGLLATSLSGLMAAQRSLEAVQHNIANVSTEGYSRQRVQLETKPAQLTSGGYIGQGVNITNVTRSYDQFINKQLSSSLSSFNDVDHYHQLAANVDNLIADPSTGIAPLTKRFFNAVNEVANNPTSIPSRQVMLSEANVLTQGFNTMSGKFEEIRTLNNNDMGAMVDNINTLATSIASLNVQISAELARSQGLRQPNDLLDQQDALLSKLAEIVNVTVIPQTDGTKSVFIGSGQTLVLNAGTSVFTTLPSPFDPTKLNIGIKTANNGTMDITSQISGGTLAGSLRFRDEVLDPAQQELGRVAAGLAMEFNALHDKGFDLSGNAGTDLFSFAGTEIPVTQGSLNTGNATVTANYQDVNVNPAAAGNLDYSDFSLKFTGGVNYTLTRIRDNQVINLTATETSVGSNIFTLTPAIASDVLPGIDITVDLNGVPLKTISPGDESVIRPTYSAAQKIGVNIDDPRKIAAATNIEVGNFPKTNALGVPVLDASGNPVIEFGPVPKLDASGVPVLDALGNPVYVHINGPMPSDNRNALQLANLENKSSMLGGSATFSDAYGQIVSGVGTLTQSSGSIAAAQETLLNQAKGAREGLAGVNLDEEAASLIKFQQAYQASAQSISVAKSLFDTLIGAVR